jgi:hypothetical protein
MQFEKNLYQLELELSLENDTERFFFDIVVAILKFYIRRSSIKCYVIPVDNRT